MIQRSASSSSLHKEMGVSSSSEAYFVLAVGLLFALNSGFINGLCLSGLLTKEGSYKQAVTSVTTAYTKAGLYLADGLFKEAGFEFSLILAFVGGAFVSGLMTPKAIPYKVVPSYGPTFLLGSLCLFAAAWIADHNRPHGRVQYFFAATANGMQNGMSSMYTANLIRTSHLTGTSTDIGLILGQMLRGNWKNFWRLKVLVGLTSSFWVGGLISFYAATEFFHRALWFSAGLFFGIGMTHLAYVMLTQKVTLLQASFGKWDAVHERMACPMVDEINIAFNGIDDEGPLKNNGDKLNEGPDKLSIGLNYLKSLWLRLMKQQFTNESA
ncbi:hypothetical protein ACHAW5_000116 [Stephanodiscus triporus]|uniref:DUF1275 domain-containing protein n=1 Tax=Stephanodiscus triporus TaxID=2934178 RepID=A0ABD3MQF3_9STRA